MVPRPVRAVLRVAALALLTVASGCGSASSLSQEDEARARDALDKALTAWKKGEPPAKWMAKTAPVRFVDDAWIKGNKLTDYEIMRITANRDGFPEAIVRLSLKPVKGAPADQKALYGINVKEPRQVVIGRDPMY